MVNVHHYGLKDKPSRTSQPVQYAKRKLLGINQDDQLVIQELIFKKLLR